jgi:hypothetical protein
MILGGDSMNIKELRIRLNLTQKEASELLHIPLRTYINYEKDESKKGSIKYLYIIEKLEQYGRIDEEHGILTIEKIKTMCQSIFSNYDVEYCYLFGSYAKKTANETSDIDLLISTTVSGMDFYGLVEELREVLKKKVEVITLASLEANTSLINEILKDGIRIYG